MVPTSKKSIPPGYTFLNIEAFMSVKAKDLVMDLLTKARRGNPDVFDMHIYDEFYAHAVFDLVDRTLATIYYKMKHKNYAEAYFILEGLTVFNQLDSSWLACEDENRTKTANKLYGAAIVTLLRAIDKAGHLSSKKYPSLEDFLRRAAEWGRDMNITFGEGMDYSLFCEAIAKRLFKDKTPAHLALDIARLVEFGRSLPGDQDIEVKNKVKRLKKLAMQDRWYMGAGYIDERDGNPNFGLPRIWREYKEYLRKAPKEPLHGGPGWDITKWPEETKAEFVNDGGSADEFEAD